MNCHEIEPFLHAYLDGEFGEEERVAIVAHLQTCEACQKLALFEEDFIRRLKWAPSKVSAPPWLKQNIRRALKQNTLTHGWFYRSWKWTVPTAAAATLLIAVMVVNQRPKNPDYSIAEQSIDWHRLHIPMDVRSSSPDSIRRFFQDKVSFAVRPPVFSQPRIELTGARLANLKEYRAAYITYQVDGRRISVFVFDPNAIPRSTHVTRIGKRKVQWQNVRGYNVVFFTSGKTGYAVTSDLDRQRMLRLIADSE